MLDALSRYIVRLYDMRDPRSFTSQLRRRRFALFERELLFPLARQGTIKIVDLGGSHV